MLIGNGMGFLGFGRVRQFQKAVSWTPASLGANLKGWWKADAGVRARTAAQFTAANSETLSRADEAAIKAGDIDFYWCGWFYLDADQANYRALCVKGLTINGTQNYALYVASDEKPIFIISNKAATWGSGLSTATWYFIEGYHDAANDLVGVCVNRGTDVTAATAGAVPDSTNTAALTFGKDSGGIYYDGRMGNVGFFKRLPSTAERDAIYNSGAGRRYADLAAAGVSLTSLTGWWEMDENSGTRADKSGNALTLTDNNTVTASDGKVDYAAADGDAVWKWEDQSGEGNDHTQTTHVRKPLYTANYFDTGRWGIVGDGSDDALSNSLVLAAVWSAGMVGRNDRAAANANRFWTPRPATDTPAGMTGAGSGTPFWAWFSNQAAAVTDLFATKLKGRFILVRESDAVMRYRLDGATTGTFDPSNNAPATGMAVLASTGAGVQSFLGGIGELIVVDAALTAGEEVSMSDYLEGRWS